MAEAPETAVNAGEQVANAPSSLPLKSEDQFRLINQRLDNLSNDLSRVSAPPAFRFADVIQLIAIFVGILVVLLGAFNLSERISEIRSDQATAERRVTDGVNAVENRLGSRLDKLNDQFISINERISRMEGAKGLPPK
jgi:hypothetical protein